MRIDCTACEMYRSEHCDDCLVTALLHPPALPVDIDDDLDPCLESLASAGLVPVLKFRPRPPKEGDHGALPEAGEAGAPEPRSQSG